MEPMDMQWDEAQDESAKVSKYMASRLPKKIKKRTKGSDARVLDILLEVENLILRK
jgi:hypothetical protein